MKLLLTFAMVVAGEPAAPEIVDVRRIWDAAPHNAFTDLVRFRDQWFCTFREGSGHIPGTNGGIRVIVSEDGRSWSSAAFLLEDGVDLRDPKLCVTPDGRLMLVMGGSLYSGDESTKRRSIVGRQPRVAFSENGADWSSPKRVLEEGDWLWRVTWHEGVAWGVSYVSKGRAENAPEWPLRLCRSENGVDWRVVRPLDVTGRPNETTLRFRDDGTMIALVRREGAEPTARIGVSKPPYREWTWNDVGHRVGGPNFLVGPGETLWAAGRSYPGGAKTVLARMSETRYEPVLTLPSGGDTSYPGMVMLDGLLWMSYYSSHEGKTAIYLSRIRLGD